MKLYQYDPDTRVLISVKDYKNTGKFQEYDIKTGQQGFKAGYTDIVPAKGLVLYPNVSPKFDLDTQTWTVNKEDLDVHLESIHKEKQEFKLKNKSKSILRRLMSLK